MFSKPSNTDEINKGLRSVLTRPVMYTLFGRFMGLSKKYKMYVEQYIKPFPGMRIIDIGCGTAEILNSMPIEIDYTGFDINTEYINYAKKKYGNRAKFYNQRVNEMTMVDAKPFDAVIADGLLHHLNDNEAKKFFKIAHNSLNKNGFVLTIDPTFCKKQNRLDRFLTSLDRGQHIRQPDEYLRIAQSNFTLIKTYVVNGVSNLPLTGCLLKCLKE